VQYSSKEIKTTREEMWATSLKPSIPQNETTTSGTENSWW
jgi:hypothetical protein